MNKITHYKALLTKIDKLDGETLEEMCKRLLWKMRIGNYSGSYKNLLLDNFIDEFILIDNEIYSIKQLDIPDGKPVYQSKLNKNGTISVELKYSKQNVGFSKAINMAVKNIK